MKIEPSTSNPQHKDFMAALRQVLSATPANVQNAIAAAKAEKFSYRTKYTLDHEDSHG